MKLCKDCKHITQPVGMGAHYQVCAHPEAPVDLVFGEKNGTCELMRSSNCLVENCGLDGKWFEPVIETIFWGKL